MTRPNSYDVEKVVAELSELAAGQGFTAAKARRQEALLALGYLARSSAPGEDPVVAGLRFALLGAIALMRRRPDRVGSPRRYYPAFLIAESALALGRHARQSLMDRRNDAASSVGAAGTTFAKYEREVLREVAVILVSHRDHPTALDERLATAESVEQQTTGNWSIVSQDRLVYLDERGIFTNYSRRAEIQSKIDGLREVELWTEYFADPRQGVINAVHAVNARILREADRAGGHLTHLSLEPPLRREEARRIGIDYVFRTDVPAFPRIRCSAISDMTQTRIAMQFDAMYRPAVVWHWNQVGMGDEFVPAPHRLLEVLPSGYVEHTFYGIRAGSTYGLAWEWPAD